MDLKETELTLGLPGENPKVKSCYKRGFSDLLDLNLRTCWNGWNGKQLEVQNYDEDHNDGLSQSTSPIPPPPKAQVVGWPPVRAGRKNAMMKKYVKVAVDGAPYLRKVDLGLYNTYHQLSEALEDMFSCYIIRNIFNDRKLIMDPINGSEYVPTYEDKDGDWMMVGDVPWKLFVESCKRIRLMKRFEESGLEPRTPSQVD